MHSHCLAAHPLSSAPHKKMIIIFEWCEVQHLHLFSQPKLERKLKKHFIDIKLNYSKWHVPSPPPGPCKFIHKVQPGTTNRCCLFIHRHRALPRHCSCICYMVGRLLPLLLYTIIIIILLFPCRYTTTACRLGWGLQEKIKTKTSKWS